MYYIYMHLYIYNNKSIREQQKQNAPHSLCSLWAELERKEKVMTGMT